MNRNKGIRFFVDTIRSRDSFSFFFFLIGEKKGNKQRASKNLYAHIFVIRSFVSFTSYIVSIMDYCKYANGNTIRKCMGKFDDD